MCTPSALPEDLYACPYCGSTIETPRGAGCWFCEDNAGHPVPAGVTLCTESEVAQLVARGMLYITTKLAEARLLEKGTDTTWPGFYDATTPMN